jgi:DNA-binding IclR family transcriptional regulator
MAVQNEQAEHSSGAIDHAVPAGSANSLERMLSILDIIEESGAEVSFETFHQRLGYTRSTLYRYLKILADAGLITSLPELGYTLGPRVTELDYVMRKHDPLIIAGAPVMAELVRVQPGVALLCRRYRDKVLCVYQESSTESFRSTYERGRARPLLRGATSRVILANIQSTAVARLYEQDPQAFSDAGFGADLASVRAALRRIRQAGWDCTEGQVTPGVTGVAAPIFDARGAVLGSISLSIGRTRVEQAEILVLADRIRFCAGIVTKAISQRSKLQS